MAASLCARPPLQQCHRGLRRRLSLFPFAVAATLCTAPPLFLRKAFCATSAPSVLPHRAPVRVGMTAGDKAAASAVEVTDTGNTPAFSWTKNWYPVATVLSLDPARPHSVYLMNEELVLWRDGEQRWRAFKDACPHRKVPLSEGRIEPDGTLMCAYHAWRFDSSGKCVSLPQLEAGPPKDRLCATARPTMESHGLVWVWGESGEQSEMEAALTPPIAIDENLEDSSNIFLPSSGFKDLPYGWDTFFDNTMDIAHGPATHHGIVGSRYLDTEPHTLNASELRSTGFEFDVVRPENSRLKDPTLHVEFRPPVLQKAMMEHSNGAKAAFYLFATPTRPGWCRTYSLQVLIKNSHGEVKGFLGSEKSSKLPSWLMHPLGSMFIHQDMVFLHGSERRLLSEGYRELHESLRGHAGALGVNTKYQEAVNLTIGADKSTALFRRWLAEHGKGGMPWHGDPSFPPAEGLDLYDTFHTHTANCVICTRTLRRVERLRNVLGGLGAMLGTATIARLGFSSASLWWGLAAALAGVASITCHKFSRLFYRYEFHHQDNN